tara:strand:+ start:484 stop:714 length:231 start_codon:yes stop_codon:yes gene_type:complete
MAETTTTQPINIWLMKDSRTFEKTEVKSRTVGDLRNELDLDGYTVNVDKVTASDDHQLVDDNRVAVVRTNEKGGNI